MTLLLFLIIPLLYGVNWDSYFGSVAGALGSFAVLRKQSLLGDCIAHAALPGICIAFLLTLTKSSFSLLVGAIVAGLLATLFYQFVIEQSLLKSDTVLVYYFIGIFWFWFVFVNVYSKTAV